MTGVTFVGESLPLVCCTDRAGQRTELIGKPQRTGPDDHRLAFANPVHDFDARQVGSGSAKSLEPEHRSGDAYRSMVLLDDVAEVLDLPNHHRNVLAGTDAVDSPFVGTTLVHRHLLKATNALRRCLEEAHCRSPVALRRQQYVDRRALLVPSAIER